jgi:hypothetical protein
MKNLRLHQTHRIKMVIIESENQVIEIKNYEISYTMFSIPVPEDPIGSSRNQNRAFLKVNFFIKGILDGSVLYTSDDLEELTPTLLSFDNNYVVLPNATDTTLLEALHCKLNVLCGETTFIDDLSLTDADSGIGYSMAADLEELEYSLPKQSDWLPGHSFWDAPWWTRYDITTFDNCSESEQDVIDFRETDTYKVSLTQELDQIDEQVAVLFNQKQGKTAEVIELDQIRADQEAKKKWKPTVI